MKSNKLVKLFLGACVCSQLVGCSAIKDRFIVETEPVETEPAFGVEESTEEVTQVEETTAEVVDTSASDKDILNQLYNTAVINKTTKTDELSFNLKDIVDSTAVEQKLLTVYNEEIEVDTQVAEENPDASTVDGEIEKAVEIVEHIIGDDESALVNVDTALSSLGFDVTSASYTVYYNDFLGAYGAAELDINILPEVAPYNTTRIGGLITGLSSHTKDNVSCIELSLTYKRNSTEIDVKYGLDFNENRVKYVDYKILLDAEDKEFTYTDDKLAYADLNLDANIESGKVYNLDLYEFACDINEELIEVERETEASAESSESEIPESTEPEMETITLYHPVSIEVKKYVSDADVVNYLEVSMKGKDDDSALETKVSYLGEVSVNNKPLDTALIINSKDFSIATSKLELFGAKPYKFVVYIEPAGVVESEVQSYSEIKDLYNPYMNDNSYINNRMDFEIWATAPGEITLHYTMSLSRKIDKIYFVGMEVLRGTYSTEDGEEVFTTTTTDKDAGIKYTTAKKDITGGDTSAMTEGLSKSDGYYIGNGEKYYIKIKDNFDSILIGRYWN
jgi:hypothetical protein